MRNNEYEWTLMAFASTVLHAVVKPPIKMYVISKKSVCNRRTKKNFEKLDHFDYRKCKICERILNYGV